MVSERKIELDENQSDIIPGIESSKEQEQFIRDEDVLQSSITQGPRRSKRVRRQPERYGFLISPHVDINLIEEDEQAMYEKVIQDIISSLWHDAMKSKMDSKYTN